MNEFQCYTVSSRKVGAEDDTKSDPCPLSLPPAGHYIEVESSGQSVYILVWI